MPTRCQDCNASFLLDGTTVVNGISCPDCGSTKLERDQPSPTHSDGEVRDMVDPATQLDQGGNPLQEGVWAGVDGGWQPEYRRDESFASVKTASRPGISWTPGVVGNGGWDTQGNLHAWNVKHLPPQVDIAHPPFIIGADGTILSVPHPYSPVDVMDRVPGTKAQGYRPNLVSKTAAFDLPPSGIDPQVHGTAQPQPPAGLHHGNLHWLSMLDASINGKPVRTHQTEIWKEHGFPTSPSFGQPVTVSVHHPEHLDAAIELAESPQVSGVPSTLAHVPTFSALGSAMKRGQAPLPPGLEPQPAPPQVMSSHYDRALSQEPYLPWYHQADVQSYPAGGGDPRTLTNDEWAQNKRQRYLDKNHGGHRLNWEPGVDGRGIMIGSQLHTWPVEKTMDDPQGGMMHGEYLSALRVNPANVDLRSGFEIAPDGTVVSGNVPPEASQIDPRIRAPQADPFAAFGSTKESFLPLLEPLVAPAARMLLGRAVGGLMKKAIGGAGNFLDTGGQQPAPAGAPPVSLVASERVGVGHDAPFESPGSTPRIVEDHDPEAVDQQEFNDGDTSPAFNNPNKDDADAGMAQSTGEDGMHQKLEFRHDGDGVSQAEQLLPTILEFIESPESGLSNPQLKALHETLEREIPGYLDHANEDSPEVQQLLEELRKPDSVTAAQKEHMKGVDSDKRQRQYEHIKEQCLADGGSEDECKEMAARTVNKQRAEHGETKSSVTAAPVYQGTPIPMQQMQMGQPQQMAMPGTHQNPIQPGGMPVDGKCMNCGGVTNADGSCPQCGAAPGANQMGNMQAAPQAGGQQMNPPGFMRPAMGHTAADHQGPITPQQKEVFAQYLIDQGRNDEVAAMMTNPGLYADEWAQYINKSTQPPEVDPAEQAPMPQVPPDQMGQMPVPGMNIPQPTAAATDCSCNCHKPGWTGTPGCWCSCPDAKPRPKVADAKENTNADNPRRCPNCSSATTNLMNGDGSIRCHRCGHIWEADVMEDTPVISRTWIVKKAYPDALNDAPNPVAAPAADATAPGDRENQQDSTLSWQSTDGTPLQVGQTYEMHSSYSPIPDVVKVDAVKPDSIVVTMVGEYNSPSDPQDADGPGYQHELDLNEAQAQNLTFNPVDSGEGEQEESQDQNDQDGIGQTVNTEPVKQSPEVPYHARTASEGVCSLCSATTFDGICSNPKCPNSHDDAERAPKTADLNEGVPEDGICKVCGNALDSTEHLHGCSAAKLAAQHEAFGGKMVDQDPRGQFQVGQRVTFNTFGGRTTEGTIVGFQPGHAMDPFVHGDHFGDVRVISRREILPSEPQQVQAEPQQMAASVSTDECPKCQYGHVTSSYTSPTEIAYECFRCAHQWKVADLDEDSELAPRSRDWLNEDSSGEEINFDPSVLEGATAGAAGRDIREIAKRDPRNAELRDRLNKNAGAKFSPREQKEFIDEEGTARNADRLNLDGTHYVESAFDNSKARPDRVNDNYLGLGL